MGLVTRAAPVELRLLGRFAAVRDSVEVPPAAFGGRKVRTLVKVLASRQGRFVSNDLLAEALWPGRPPADPVANLQVLVNRARHALGDPTLILTGQGGYALAARPACSVDTEELLAGLAEESPSSARLRKVLSWWQGDPLPEEAYDAWAADYRGELFRARQQALERAATLALEEDDAEAAAELAGRAAEAEPLREVAVLLFVRALVASGDGAAALTAYDDYRRSLAEELGVDPSAEAAALHRDLLHALPPRTAARRRRQQGFGELRFVGREPQIDRLRAALSPRTGDGTVVTVAGASGTGKSRLLAHLGREAALIRVRAYRPERSEPWTLLRTLVRELVAQDLGHVDSLPSPMAGAVRWLLPELAAPSAEGDVDPESRRMLLEEASLRLLEAVGCAVAVDDLQWCDPSSLAVLDAAIARAGSLALILAYRPEELGEDTRVVELLRRFGTVPDVALGALPEPALADLVDDPAVVDALSRFTDRTPMAVSEVLRALAAEGLATTSAAGRWHSVGEEAGERAAVLGREGQRLAIATRVADGPLGDREVLGLLALMARETAVSTLVRASGVAEPVVLDGLSRLFRRSLVRLGDHGWATAHDMVTEVVVSGLDPVERVTRHADLARALAAEDDPSLLGHHLRGAGDRRGAADSYAVAAQRALDALADDEAAELAGHGLALEPAAPVRAALLEVRGEARQRRGDLGGARDDLRAALGFHTSGVHRSRILARMALLASGADDLVRASQLAELAVVEAGEEAPVRARALEVASVLDMNLEREDRAASRAEDALAIYERLGDAGGMARVIDARAMAQFLGGDVRGGGVALRRAADLFEDSGDLVRVGTPRSTSGHALVFAGRAEAGLVDISSALELARTLGHPEGQAYARWHRAEALAALDRGEEAAAEAAEALRLATDIRHRGWTATAWRAVGLAAEARGALDEALAAYRTSLDLSEHLGLFACWGAARAALVLVRLGDPASGVPLVARALEEGPALGHYEARWAQAEVAAALGEDDAPALAARAVALMDTGGVQQGRDRLQALVAPSG